MAEYGKYQIASAVTETYLLMKDNGSGKLVVTSAVDDAPLGIYLGKGSADDRALLALGGVVVSARASGAISKGEPVGPSAAAGDNGYVKHADTTGDVIVGEALQDADDQDKFDILLYLNKTTTAA